MYLKKRTTSLIRRYHQINAVTISVLMMGILIFTSTNGFADNPLAPYEFASSVNINTATPDQLAEKLLGVGPKKAEAIVAYRLANGPFSTVEDLLLVKGIGQATLDKNRLKIRI